jgi:predicted DNA-binding transcriptional regulator YafY
MRRADRLFDIIQTLRTSARPLTARALAERLEVAPRTIYRDIAALQARRVPIEGAPGVGYMLRRGYDLPALTFTIEEIEAIAVGVRMVCRLRDEALRRAAESVLSKLTTAVPEAMRLPLAEPPIWVSEGRAQRPAGVNPAAVRGAIRAARKLRIVYVDERGGRTHRTIRPISMVYYVDVTLIAAWCELREDIRHFRIERVESCAMLEEGFANAGELMARWRALHEQGIGAVVGRRCGANSAEVSR